MNENPYDILGVPRDAPLDDVKKAYRKKARENHPDLNPDDPKAEERMNKVNEAYDRIVNPEKYAASDARKRGYGAPYSPNYNGYGDAHASGRPGGSQGHGDATGTGYGYSGQGGAGDPYAWTTINFEDLFGGGWGSAQGPIHPEATASDSPEVRQAVFLINSANYQEAIRLLQDVPSTGRDARWNYLFALANNGAGNTVAANDHIRKARQLDPNNPDYMRAQQQFVQGGRRYQQAGEGRGFTSFGIDASWLLCCICFGPMCLNYATRLCYAGYYGG